MQQEAILRRLIFAKYLLRLAGDEARKPDPLCAVSMLLQHDAVELVLALGAEHHNVGTRKTDFAQYFGLLENAIAPETLAHRESMRRLNDARVSLKHHGTTPSRREVLSFYSAARDFVQDNMPRLFGLSFDDVSMANIIEAQPVRECLRRADGAFKQNDLMEAGRAISEAFARLLREYKIALGSGRGMRGEMREFEAHLDRSGRTGPLTRLGEVVDEMHDELALLRQGVDTRALNVFRSLTPNAAIAMAGNARFTSSGGAPPADLDQLRFCYDFVVDSALSIEQAHSAVSDIVGGRYVRSRFGSA